MITEDTIRKAVAKLVEAATPERVVLFGSYARGEARADSDLDLLVVEHQVADRAKEMVRLTRALRPLGVPADILVVSTDELKRYGRVAWIGLLAGAKGRKGLYG